ncbi:hypothetical protein ACIOHR_30430 [Streptomyces anulatus]
MSTMLALPSPGCVGQQVLEEQLMLAWGQAEADGNVDPGPAGIRLGQACLHLDLRPDPLLFSFLLAVLVPYLEAPADGVPEFSGVAGLRLVSTNTHRFVLRRWDGHGCLVLHTDEHGVARWEEWTALRPQESAEAGRGLEPLWHHKELCEQETRALLLGDGAAVCDRGAGRHPAQSVPEDRGLAHEPRWGSIQLPAPPRVAIPAPRVPGPVELSPAELTPLTGPVSPALLGDALAEQLIGLLKTGRIRSGDVLIDHVALVTKLGGRAAAARWAQLVIEHVAKRYGLLRYRRRRPGDPAGRRPQDHVWAVSEGAPALAEVAAAELGLPLSEITEAGLGPRLSGRTPGAEAGPPAAPGLGDSGRTPRPCIESGF